MHDSWPSWVEVRLDHLVHNTKEIKKFIGQHVQLLAVVKANGYGHGGVAASWAAIQGGAEILGVNSPPEGIELRNAGIKADILVMGGCFHDQAKHVIDYDLIQAVHNRETFHFLESLGRKRGKQVRIHLKIDTGMGRLGFYPETLLNLWDEVISMKHLHLEGVFSHFAVSEKRNKNYSKLQIQRFEKFKKDVESKGLEIVFWHICNSGGILDLPQAHYNMVRCGLLLYGVYPSKDVRHELDLKPVLTWKSRIVAIKNIHQGDSVSYGRHWIAKKEEIIAIIPLGYHDGYDRKLTNKGEVIIRNQRVPVIGDVCMDNLIVLVTDVPNVRIGDEVVLIGSMNSEMISTEEVAQKVKTISYEVLCRIGRRIPRVHLWKDQEIGRFSFLDPLGQFKVIKNGTDYSRISV